MEFEGKYLNDKKLFGKEYWNGGKSQFEGKYLNDKKLFGKEYLYDFKGESVHIYEGEFLNGNKNGKGKLYYNGKLIFEGSFLNGFISGHGKEYNKNWKLIYEGEYLNYKRFKKEKVFKIQKNY